MKFYVIWRTSLRAILKNKKRSMLTMLGIIIGIASVIAIVALGKGFERKTMESLTASEGDSVRVPITFVPKDANLTTSNIELIDPQDVQQIETIDGVKDVMYPKSLSSAVYREIWVRDKFEQKQVDFMTDKFAEKILHGRPLTSYDNAVANKVAAIDEATSKALFDTPENAIGRGVEIDGQLYTIVGVYPASETASMFSLPESNVIIPASCFKAFDETEKDSSMIFVTLEDGVIPSEVTSQIIEMLEEQGVMRESGTYEVFDVSMLTDSIGLVINSLTYFISAVAGISLFIAGVGVMNMMYISVSERTKEIGIRRSLGATAKAIKLQFLLEGVTITVIGGIIGYICGMLMASLAGHFLKLPIAVDIQTVSLAIGVSMAIGLIFSVMPASQAAKKELIDILR